MREKIKKERKLFTTDIKGENVNEKKGRRK